MKKIAFASLFTISLVGLAAAEDITGYVSEAHCGAKHSSVSDANTKCVDVCMKKGADPVLVKDGKVMTFDADSKDKAKSFAGQNVKINGSVEGSVVKISSIDKAE